MAAERHSLTHCGENLMRLFPKANLEWKEPKTVRKVIDKMEWHDLSAWNKLAIVVIIPAVYCMAYWFMGRADNALALRAIVMGVTTFFFFAYVIPWISCVFSSVVQMFDTYILQSRGFSHISWKFKDIARCEIASLETEEGLHSVLVVHTYKGKHTTLGLTPDIIPQLTETLARLNVKVEKPQGGSSSI